ncbi:MAG: AlkZ-related protein [Pyrinomonadaceae bacterium]
MPIAAATFKQVFGKLLKLGFLLESDPKLPSICTLITGAPLRGSWWAHPLAQTIFQVNEKLEDHPDVLITKLISGKITFVHRDLWPEILAIGTARKPWQMESLSAPAQELLKTVEESGELRSDRIDWSRSRSSSKNKPGDTARELERKLLVHAEQIHTASGAHAKLLETWEHWSQRTGFAAPAVQTDQAKRNLEERLRKLNDEFEGKARLPWNVG